MSVVSYRLYCRDCDEETVVREGDFDETSWRIVNLHYHEGVCPSCTGAEPEQISLEALDNIGEKAAQNLREAGYDTEESIVDASDEELLDVAWVGEAALFSLKEAVGEHPPQQRWDE